MPIVIQDADGGIGHIIVTKGTITGKELVDSLQVHAGHEQEKFKNYKYILIDHTALTKVDISNEAFEFIAGLWSDFSSVHPDSVAAMVTNVGIGADIDLINRISRMHELFIHRSHWETLVFRTRIEAVRWIKEKVRDKFGIQKLTLN